MAIKPGYWISFHGLATLILIDPYQYFWTPS